MMRKDVQHVDVAATKSPPRERRPGRAQLAAETDDGGEDFGDPITPFLTRLPRLTPTAQFKR